MKTKLVTTACLLAFAGAANAGVTAPGVNCDFPGVGLYDDARPGERFQGPDVKPGQIAKENPNFDSVGAFLNDRCNTKGNGPGPETESSTD